MKFPRKHTLKQRSACIKVIRKCFWGQHLWKRRGGSRIVQRKKWAMCSFSMENSDVGTALENTIVWSWRLSFYTLMLISHCMWVPWKEALPWVKTGVCTWGSSQRGLTAVGCLFPALPKTRGTIFQSWRGDQSNASQRPPQVCCLWSRVQYYFLLFQMPQVNHHKMSQECPSLVKINICQFISFRSWDPQLKVKMVSSDRT